MLLVKLDNYANFMRRSWLDVCLVNDTVESVRAGSAPGRMPSGDTV